MLTLPATLHCTSSGIATPSPLSTAPTTCRSTHGRRAARTRQRHVDKFGALLTDGTHVGAHLVLTADAYGGKAVRTLGSLALIGVHVESIVDQS